MDDHVDSELSVQGISLFFQIQQLEYQEHLLVLVYSAPMFAIVLCF